MLIKEWKILEYVKIIIDLLTPLFIGLIIAWLFKPLVNYLEDKKVRRGISILAIYIVLISFLYLLVAAIIPVLYEQVSELAKSLPSIFETVKNSINGIIDQAKQYKTNPFTTLSVNKKSETVSITNDNKFYQSDEVSVVGSTSSPLINSFESYSVTINNAPEGTVIVKQDGTAYTADELKNMTPTSKFYVRVPVDKVTDKSKKIELSINGIR